MFTSTVLAFLIMCNMYDAVFGFRVQLIFLFCHEKQCISPLAVPGILNVYVLRACKCADVNAKQQPSSTRACEARSIKIQAR